ncbi:MAG: hypothetical protein M1840_009177 [Geoglossum simile]|nr:MAG: hypothetical protein M1840_009177 [Geoglossum simile]
MATFSVSFTALALEHWVVTLVLFAIFFEASRIIYRLLFHPLSGFPGPKLAAATSLYAIYYDMALTGRLVKQMALLHEQYGPVVRVMPDELHVKDIDAYYQVYKIGTEFAKSKRFYDNPLVTGSLLCIHETPEAKKRKDAFNPFFSKAAVRRVEFLCHEKLAQFLDALRKAGENSAVVDISRGYRCLTADVIMHYSYQRDFGALSSKDFRCDLIDAFDELAKTAKLGTYFKKTFVLVNWVASLLPKSVLARVMPPMITVVEFQENCRSNIQYLKRNPRNPNSTTPSIFDILLNPDANKGRPVPSDDDLTAEAVLMLAAGMDTTANALRFGTWSVISDQRVYRKLKEELRRVMPDRDAVVDSAMLENLPYLTGVVKESIRLSYGVPGRLARTVPASGAVICGWQVPAGTTISQSSYVYHTDEKYFQNASSFLPERWLGDNAKELDRNMLSFSRGSRICLGLNLATTELFLTFAHLFRRFELKVHGTTAGDMEWDDFYVPVFRGRLKVLLELADE